MEKYPVLLDIHTHSLASGHGSVDTINAMAKSASKVPLKILGISDHGPATSASCKSSYFRNLTLAPRKRFGVSLLYGIELNILNQKGDVDLPDDVLESLDYAFISMHKPLYSPGSADENTLAYIRAMEHPKVHFIGHADDGKFPVDFKALLYAAKARRVYPEINNRSLMPCSYRKNSYVNSLHLLSLCKKMDFPILLSSDSHGASQVGNMDYIIPALEKTAFPPKLIINSNLPLLHQILQ